MRTKSALGPRSPTRCPREARRIPSVHAVHAPRPIPASGASSSQLIRLDKPQSFVTMYKGGERRVDVIGFVAICRTWSADFVEILRRVAKLTWIAVGTEPGRPRMAHRSLALPDLAFGIYRLEPIGSARANQDTDAVQTPAWGMLPTDLRAVFSAFHPICLTPIHSNFCPTQRNYACNYDCTETVKCRNSSSGLSLWRPP